MTTKTAATKTMMKTAKNHKAKNAGRAVPGAGLSKVESDAIDSVLGAKTASAKRMARETFAKAEMKMQLDDILAAGDPAKSAKSANPKGAAMLEASKARAIAETAAKSVKAKPAAEAKTETVAACARRMVIEGATNEEILLVLVDVYELPEAHAHYPGWYRANCVRKGLVTAEFAAAHAH